MEKREITETDIIRCLSMYKELLEDIRERIRILNANVDTTNEVLETLQLRSKGYGCISPQGSNKDLGDVLEKYKENEEQYALLLKSHLLQLIEEEETIKRIWICYQSRPHPQRIALKMLYVQHKAWKVVKAELRISHSTLSKNRMEGISNIKKVYASDLTDQQILMYRHPEPEQPKRREKEQEQMSLWQMGIEKREEGKK